MTRNVISLLGSVFFFIHCSNVEAYDFEGWIGKEFCESVCEDNVQSKLNESRLARQNFRNFFLPCVDFKNAQAQNADFSGAVLICAHFDDADLENVNFSGANILGASFKGAHLKGSHSDYFNVQKFRVNDDRIEKPVFHFYTEQDLAGKGLYILSDNLEDAQWSIGNTTTLDLDRMKQVPTHSWSFRTVGHSENRLTPADVNNQESAVSRKLRIDKSRMRFNLWKLFSQ